MTSNNTLFDLGVKAMVLLISIYALVFASNTVFLYNEAAVTTEILNNPYLEDFEVIELKRITVGGEIVGNVIEWDIEGKRIKNYGLLVRTFQAWRYPRGSVEENENWTAFGFIDMDKRVFLKYVKLESELGDHF